MAKKKRKQKRRRVAQKVFLYLSLFALVLFAGWYFSDYFEKPPFVSYPEFGIMLPSGFRIHGIDVSKYQSAIGWPQVAEMRVDKVKIGFVFIKATEGIGNIDPYFKRNWRGAKQAGLVCGAYHFFIPTRSGKAQAQHFIEMTQLTNGDLRPVLDVEHTYGTPKAILQQRVADWLEAVEKEYGVKPIIYTNINFYLNFLAGRFDGYPLWVAHYFADNRPRITREWSFWQHSEKGKVNGIRGSVDFNVFKGDSADFNKYLIP